ncbi:hypothetical protein [Actinocatenispora rupis]|uniref:LPXTG-motif cell wall anchor domain-containing protein n=1 Tax=Actinocatenispora rupis TaxID=519421 RepID=A0A8J3J196_9ACTN|nr:hypothetical protein [Actinocatenispora rupis]GID13931.1 hypothetical protein Aru02nite_48200 [Actinocatenispora rupis]
MSTDRRPAPTGHQHHVHLLHRNGSARVPGGPGRRLVGTAFGVAAVVMVPWMLMLSRTLPESTRARHWSLAWIGFDAVLAIGLAATGFLAWRRHSGLVVAATATGTLLVVDAWFDVITSAPGADLTQALLLATCCELPVAAACLTVGLLARRR